jgi:hypothetical protein
MSANTFPCEPGVGVTARRNLTQPSRAGFCPTDHSKFPDLIVEWCSLGDRQVETSEGKL